MENQLKKSKYEHGYIFDATVFTEYDTIEKELSNSLSNSEGIIGDMCNHIADAGGKRIRPLLVMFTGKLFSSKDYNDLVKVAVAAELIHMASLVHDDIIDESVLRKSRPSINHLWGNQYAVLCGDFLFAKAFSLLSDTRSIYGMRYMIEAIQSMCHGEVLQASEKYDINTSLNLYYDKIAKKTAKFLECCCKSGAALAGAEEDQIALTAQFGLNLGYAFQIEDDILDFCGNPEVMGKPSCEDLRQGNLTLPVILLMDNKKYGSWIRQLISKKYFSEEDIEEVKLAMDDTGIFNTSYEIAQYHLEKAKGALRLLPMSDYNQILVNIIDILKARVN